MSHSGFIVIPVAAMRKISILVLLDYGTGIINHSCLNHSYEHKKKSYKLHIVTPEQLHRRTNDSCGVGFIS